MLTGYYYEYDSLTYDIISLFSSICSPRYTIHHVARIYGKSHNRLLNEEFLHNYFYAEYIAGIDVIENRMENLIIFSLEDNINIDKYMNTQLLKR
ncbi:MAG: hypothetical protein Kow0091_20630 [Geminocystis sp.]|uniref:Uncharacterized protein n=1 Tax=Cyanobacterium aponinum (strain PCC 10605) TaxID=755178 RepID=K9Z5E2_CYAAP|nr:hypothetical protein Cyan10605_1861 [Cyanobacterium aponinum PCC 10605]